MRCLISALVVFVASAAGCGGQIDDPAPTATTGSNSPTNTPAATGCARSCDRVRACATPYDDRDACITSCGHDFPDPARARTYASCIEALSCDEIERGLSMNYGPLGACYAKASGR
jgi:hypothetical protein